MRWSLGIKHPQVKRKEKAGRKLQPGRVLCGRRSFSSLWSLCIQVAKLDIPHYYEPNTGYKVSREESVSMEESVPRGKLVLFQ